MGPFKINPPIVKSKDNKEVLSNAMDRKEEGYRIKNNNSKMDNVIMPHAPHFRKFHTPIPYMSRGIINKRYL